MDAVRKSENGKHRASIRWNTVLHVNGLAERVRIGEQQRFLGFARNDDTGEHASNKSLPEGTGLWLWEMVTAFPRPLANFFEILYNRIDMIGTGDW